MADLASSRRGRGRCQCGATYVNRCKPANCLSCGKDLGGKFVARVKPSIPAAVRITDDVFSVKTTPTGADHRCFVQFSDTSKICLHESCLNRRNVHAAQGQLDNFSCSHIDHCSADVPLGELFFLTETKINSLPVENVLKEELVSLKGRLSGRPSAVRISEKTYAVAADGGLGYIHLNSVYSKTGAFNCFEKSCKRAGGKHGKTTGAARLTCIHLICLVASVGPDGAPAEVVVPPPVPPNRAREMSTRVLVQKVTFPEHVQDLLKEGIRLEMLGPPGGSGWPDRFDASDTTCLACGTDLQNNRCQPGSDGSATLMTLCYPFWPVRATIRQCPNQLCGALHQCQPAEAGMPLFNICNQLFVSLELFVGWRMLMIEGTPLSCAITAQMRTLLLRTSAPHRPSPSRLEYIERLLANGFWAFEVLVQRDELSALCGFCGTCPEVLIGDGNEKNCCSSRQIRTTIPIAPEAEGHVDTTASATDATTASATDAATDSRLDDRIVTQILERAVFTRNMSSLEATAADIKPFVNIHVQASTLVNTESCKSTTISDEIEGDPDMLMELIKADKFSIRSVASYSEADLDGLCGACAISTTNRSNVMKRNSLQALYDSILHGHCPCHMFTKATGQTGGYYHLVCRHGVIYGSKILTKRESVRDAVDLYLSLKYPPILLVCDSPCGVARHLELRDSDLAKTLWGDRRGCYEKPTAGKAPSEDMNIPSIVPPDYWANSREKLTEDQAGAAHAHPVSKDSARFVVGDRFHDTTSPHKSPLCRYHNIDNCIQGSLYKTSYAESQNHIRNVKRLRSSCAQSFETHYLYNKFMDYYHNQTVVRRQVESLTNGSMGVVSRGAYQRFATFNV